MGNLICHLVYTGLLLECDHTLYNFWSHTYIQCAHNRQCLAAVFLPLLERELRDFVKHWNSHRMRHNRRAGARMASQTICLTCQNSLVWKVYMHGVITNGSVIN